MQVRRAISIKIPAGVDEGTRIRLAGEGEPGTRGGSPGDLYAVLHVEPHPHFRRDNNNVMLELDINIAQAALGDRVAVPTLDGNEELAIPAGTQTGETFRLRGKGIPYLQRNGRGDQVVIVHVRTPTGLTTRQKELLQELGTSLGKEVVHQPEKGLLSKLMDALGL
jgi:molecular chaperone DnaJ